MAAEKKTIRINLVSRRLEALRSKRQKRVDALLDSTRKRLAKWCR